MFLPYLHSTVNAKLIVLVHSVHILVYGGIVIDSDKNQHDLYIESVFSFHVITFTWACQGTERTAVPSVPRCANKVFQF